MTTRLKSACKAGILVAACVSLAICSSCSDEDMMNSSGQSDKLSFGVSISDKWETAPGTRSTAGETPERSAFKFDGSDLWLIATSEEGMDSTLFTKPGKAQTRAAAVTTESFNSFGVYAYVYEGDDWASGQNVKPYFTAEKVTKSNGNLWTTSPTRFWPGEQYRMQFFACAPYDITQNVTVNDNTPKFDYTVPKDVKDQKDLIVATADVRGNHNSSVELKFKHILTAVKVKAAEGVSGTITKVALTGIKNTGNYTFGGTEWSNLDGSASFVQEFNPGKELDGSEETFVVDGDNTFMMIPQTLGENAALQITFSDGTVLTGSLFGKTDWEMRHTVIYKISRTGEEYILEVTDPSSLSYTSSQICTVNFSIKSYKTNAQGNNEAVAWTAKYYDEQKGEWITFSEKASNYSAVKEYTTDTYKNYYTSSLFPWFAIKYISGQGGATNVSQPIRLQNRNRTYEWDNKPEYEIDMNGKWREDPNYFGSSDSPYDLSTYDFYADQQSQTVNTANCYVVRHPGIYKFPLIYGNTIKNGQENQEAYVKNVLEKTFIEDGQTVELIWQDEQGLIKEVDLSSDTKIIAGQTVKYIVFKTADKDHIKQGNAVIAVKDSKGKVMWSWHIWVTNNSGIENFTTIENYQGNYYDLADLNLGLCDGIHFKWPARSATIRIEQAESGKYHDFTIRQEPMNWMFDFNYTFYQWGRKDPIIGYTSSPTDIVVYEEVKPHYNIDNRPYTSLNTSTDGTMSAVISNPQAFCTNWQPQGSYWNTKKTVFDPCPVGMRVPDKNTFTGLTYDGKTNNAFNTNNESYKDDRNGKVNTASMYYGQTKNEEHGWWFYCRKMSGISQWDESASTFFLYVFGGRNPDSGKFTLIYAYYLMNDYNSCCIQLEYNTVTINSSRLKYGGTVRPVKDN